MGMSYIYGVAEALRLVGVEKVATLGDYIVARGLDEPVAPVASREGRLRSEFVPRNKAEAKQRAKQLARKGGPKRPALEVYRENVRRHYGEKAPEYAQRLLRIADQIEMADPAAANKLKGISLESGLNSQYDPKTRTIRLDSPQEDVALHEFGHHTDRKNVKKYFKKAKKRQAHLPLQRLEMERTATGVANKQLGGVSAPLSAAYATYLGEEVRGGAPAPYDWALPANNARPRGLLRREVAEALRDKELRAAEQFNRIMGAANRLGVKLKGTVPLETVRAYENAGLVETPQVRPVKVPKVKSGTKALLTRLRESAVTRLQNLAAARSHMQNSVLSPATVREKFLAPSSPRGVWDALDDTFGAGAAAAAFQARADAQIKNLAREHPALTRVRRAAGLPDTRSLVPNLPIGPDNFQASRPLTYAEELKSITDPVVVGAYRPTKPEAVFRRPSVAARLAKVLGRVR